MHRAKRFGASDLPPICRFNSSDKRTYCTSAVHGVSEIRSPKSHQIRSRSCTDLRRQSLHLQHKPLGLAGLRQARGKGLFDLARAQTGPRTTPPRRSGVAACGGRGRSSHDRRSAASVSGLRPAVHQSRIRGIGGQGSEPPRRALGLHTCRPWQRMQAVRRAYCLLPRVPLAPGDTARTGCTAHTGNPARTGCIYRW